MKTATDKNAALDGGYYEEESSLRSWLRRNIPSLMSILSQRNRDNISMEEEALVQAPEQLEAISSQLKANAEFDDDDVKNILKISSRPPAIQEAAEHENKFLLANCRDVGLIADIGCGTARMSRILRDGYEGYNGFEFSKDMVALARLNAEVVRVMDMLNVLSEHSLTLMSCGDTVTYPKAVKYFQECLKEIPVDIVELTDRGQQLEELLGFAKKIIGRVLKYRDELSQSAAGKKLFDKLNKAKLPNATITTGDAAKAKLHGEVYDRVICCFFTSGNFRDEDREVYDQSYLDRMEKFIEIYSNFYRALKPGGKIFFSIYRGDEEGNLAAERAQRDFYRKCGLDLTSAVGSPFVTTRQGNFWSRRWTKESVLKNLAYCGITNEQVTFHELGKSEIAWIVEIRKPFPEEIQDRPFVVRLKKGRLEIPAGIAKDIRNKHRGVYSLSVI